MAIARAIRVAVTPEEEARITTAKEVNPEAYEALLRGKFFYWKTTPDESPKEVLENVKAALACGYVSMLGFTTYASLDGEEDIPFPGKYDVADGGHAILAVGYDNSRKNRGTKEKGALIIRNSWGEDWGWYGYGYLPYEYVMQGLAADFWTCVKQEWVDSGQFS